MIDFKNARWKHEINCSDIVVMSAWPSCYSKFTYHPLHTTEKQGCHPLKGKLSKYPNLSFFSPKLRYGWRDFLSIRNISQNKKHAKFTESWRINLDIGAIKEILVLNSVSSSGEWMHIFSVLRHYNFTFAMPIHGLFRRFSQHCEKRLLASSCPSVIPPAWNHSATTGRVCMKSDI